MTKFAPPYFLLSKHAIWLYMAIIAALGFWLLFGYQKRLIAKYGLVNATDQEPLYTAAPEQQEATDDYEIMD